MSVGVMGGCRQVAVKPAIPSLPCTHTTYNDPAAVAAAGASLGGGVAGLIIMASDAEPTCWPEGCGERHGEANPLTLGEIAGAAAVGAAIILPFAIIALANQKQIDRCEKERDAYLEATGRRPVPPRAPLRPKALDVPIDEAEVGSTCRNAIAGVPNTGTCAKGLLCRGTSCVRP